jgi:hypothetical protein
MTTSVKIGRASVMVTPTGLKLGSRGSVQAPGEIFGMISKGEARKLRKELVAGGYINHARQPRQPSNGVRIAA